MSSQQLVSVAVTTYNSAQFVIETLESVYQQTYKNIELLVSDDASTDNTVELCRQWLDSHAHRFTRVELITVSNNTGVSANCNRCIAAAAADWVKFIAGDDILLPTCLEYNMTFVQSRPEASIIFSQVQVYQERFTDPYFLRVIPECFPENIMAETFTAADQFKRLLVSDRINFTPSYFFNKQAVLSVGGYEDRNRLVEDYPMWLKLTQAGYKLFFFHKPTVGYRQHEAAANNRVRPVLIKPAQFKAWPFRQKHVLPLLPWDLAWKERFSMAVAFGFSRAGWNLDTKMFRVCYRLLTVYLNPFLYVGFCKKKLGRVDPVLYSLS